MCVTTFWDGDENRAAERRTASARLGIPAQHHLHRLCERHGMRKEAPGAAKDLAMNSWLLIIKHPHV